MRPHRRTSADPVRPSRPARPARAVRAARRARTAAVVAVAAFLTSACAAGVSGSTLAVAEDVHMRRVAVSQADAMPSVVDATRRLGAAMVAASPSDANVVVSPSSLAVALSMLSDGARGATLVELEQVLGASGQERLDVFAALRGALAVHDGDPATVRDDELPATPLLHLATQVVVDDDLVAEREFLRTLADGYGAGVQRVDLGSAEASDVLDAWVEHHTGGLVERSAIEPHEDLRLVLQDAIVLAARWQSPFDPALTRPQPFVTATGATVRVPTMHQELHARFVTVDGWTAARLPYAGAAMHAAVVLPPEGVDPGSVTPEVLGALSRGLATARTRLVEVRLPVLDLAPEPLDLAALVADVGAPSVLDPLRADLSGIGRDAGGQPLHLGQAVQQAVLRLDEAGTTAAAVTELGVMATSSVPPPRPLHRLVLDRPFLVLVEHQATAWPLFLAAVRDPRG